MVKTIEQILEENALAFSPNMEPHYMAELEGIWNDACIESGGDVTDAQVDEYLDVLKNMGLVIPVHKEQIDLTLGILFLALADDDRHYHLLQRCSAMCKLIATSGSKTICAGRNSNIDILLHG